MNIINEKVVEYLDTTYKSPSKELELLRKEAEANRVPIILRDSEAFLLTLLKTIDAKNILEIGTAVGYSSSCFVCASGADVVTIEADEETYNIACDNIKKLKYDDKITPLLGDARQVLENMQDDNKDKFDFVFIDAAKSHYKAFWDLAIPMCKSDAVIICDNVLMKAMTASDEFDKNRKYKTSIRKMREFLEYINNLDYADTCILPIGDGISMSKLKKEK